MSDFSDDFRTMRNYYESTRTDGIDQCDEYAETSWTCAKYKMASLRRTADETAIFCENCGLVVAEAKATLEPRQQRRRITERRQSSVDAPPTRRHDEGLMNDNRLAGRGRTRDSSRSEKTSPNASVASLAGAISTDGRGQPPIRTRNNATERRYSVLSVGSRRVSLTESTDERDSFGFRPVVAILSVRKPLWSSHFVPVAGFGFSMALSTNEVSAMLVGPVGRRLSKYF